MNNSLLNDFSVVSSKQWKQKIQFELQGEDYNESLVGKTKEGINIKPFYHPDDVNTSLSLSDVIDPSWKASRKLYIANSQKGNEKIKNSLNSNPESLILTLRSVKIKAEELFHELDLQGTELHLQTEFLSADYIKDLAEFLSDKKWQVFLHIDIIGKLVKEGNWFYNLNKDFSILKEILNFSAPFNSVISIDAAVYHNAGANIVQQLAYAVAHANEYLNFNPSGPFVFKTATGPDLFFETAKIKALRLLWHVLCKEYNLHTPCHIIAFPGLRHQTLVADDLNKTRNMYACTSAVLGGADIVCNLPYDFFYKKENLKSATLAARQLNTLKESLPSEIINGSYYPEELTWNLAEKALLIFKQIEKGGGFLKQLKNHTIQKKISENANIEQKEFIDQHHEYFKNTALINDIELYPFVKTNRRKTLIQPFIAERLSEHFEKGKIKPQQF
ncbi:methylmalonyl-CoA mutase family protein [Abyssalbus ytuae]|uniref:Methylmalonyl-CoA mutase family protein n=1 Tax=Abyssalbus ytuae TaxID=2926907 RepID=A0A9E6ZJT1_9FLAO|nr:methylmalonyl-CoA mutase family protein [Abyssalbus ytuae]UOB16922.1 methylmalonyl-CoA mutase family protein [Abyssalbus ytuae]